jgi:hypothetical protein
MIQSQLSSTSANKAVEAAEEELVDYDEDPLVAEKLEMAALEKKVEGRARKLLEKAAVNIQSDSGVEGKAREEITTRVAEITSTREKGLLEGDGEGKDNIATMSTDDDEEIDWDKIQNALDADETVDLTTVKKKKSETIPLRRSERTKGDNYKIQDKAEMAKKKMNEISGKPLSCSVLNFVQPAELEKLASASNIKLGDTAEKVSASISTIQAKEIATAALMAAKKRVAEQKQDSVIEGGQLKEQNIVPNAEVEKVIEETTKEGESENVRPPKKPPRKRGSTKQRKMEQGINIPT